MEGGEGGVQSGETAVLVAAALQRSEATSKAPEHLSRSEKKRFYKLLKRQADTREEVLRQEAAQGQRQASPDVPLRCVTNGSPQKRGVLPRAPRCDCAARPRVRRVARPRRPVARAHALNYTRLATRMVRHHVAVPHGIYIAAHAWPGTLIRPSTLFVYSDDRV